MYIYTVYTYIEDGDGDLTNYQLYVSKEKLPILEKAKEIAQREGKPLSTLIWELLEDYVKKHASGNPSFKLEKWVEEPQFKALPTLGESPNFDKLLKYDVETLKEIYDQADRWKWVVANALKQKGAL